MLTIFLGILAILFAFYFIGLPKEKDVSWGANFSQKHAQSLGLDWKEAYASIIDELGAKKIRLGTYWDYIEWEKGSYHFDELDWQIKEAEKRNVELIVVIGMKTTGWPECHIPDWASNMNPQEQQDHLLKYIEEIVLRYKDSKAIRYWQVENEPFFAFGQCPKRIRGFLAEEIDLVKSLDNKKVLVSESGEFPLWFRVAHYGDVVGATMYRKVWIDELRSYITYPFPPVFYQRKSKLVSWIFDKEVIGVELQAEPWGPKLIYDLTIKEQKKTMDLERFKKNIEFARKAGLKENYFWGVEWWYWMKENGHPEIWQEAKKVF